MIGLPDNQPTEARGKDRKGLLNFWYVVKLPSTRRESAQLCLNKLVSHYPISTPGAARSFVLVIISEQISFP